MDNLVIFVLVIVLLQVSEDEVDECGLPASPLAVHPDNVPIRRRQVDYDPGYSFS